MIDGMTKKMKAATVALDAANDILAQSYVALNRAKANLREAERAASKAYRAQEIAWLAWDNVRTDYDR